MQEKLTEEESIVLILLGQGETDKRICCDRAITNCQLRQIRKSIRAKLGARNDANAVFWAYNKGIWKF